ncbi:MAG: dihydrofolate reductase family protein [Myxococcota bacterium]
MSDLSPATLATAADVEAFAARLYGGSCPPPIPGVSHVTSCWRRPGALPTSPLVTLRINEHTPKSAEDFFVLNFSRSRADAILVSGKLLREEPETTFGLQGPAAPALAAYRNEGALRYDPPLLVVLTSGKGFDPKHVAFADGPGAPRPLVLTSPEAAEELAPKLAGTRIDVEALESLDTRRAVRWLREARGCARVAIEAGPTASRQLYDAPGIVDELSLSVFEEPRLPGPAFGPEFLSPKMLETHLGPSSTPVAVAAESGRWTFRMHLRDRG